MKLLILIVCLLIVGCSDTSDQFTLKKYPPESSSAIVCNGTIMKSIRFVENGLLFFNVTKEESEYYVKNNCTVKIAINVKREMRW